MVKRHNQYQQSYSRSIQTADSKFQRMRSVEECKSPRRRRVHHKSEGDQTEDNLSLHSAGSMLSLESEVEENVPQATEMVRKLISRV